MSRKKAPVSDKNKKQPTDASKGHTPPQKPEQPRKVCAFWPHPFCCMRVPAAPTSCTHLTLGRSLFRHGPHRLQSASAHPAPSPWSLFSWLPQRVRGRNGALWKGDGLAGELAALGLRVKEVASDGNCFFLAMADQLEVGVQLV